MMTLVKGPQKYADRMEPGPLLGATKSIAGIKGAFAILHGVVGCAGAAGTYLRSAGPVVDGYYLPCEITDVREQDIILGGNEELIMRLARRLRAELGAKARIMFLFTSCATSIIEDDIKRVQNLLEKEFQFPVVPIDTAGFYGGFHRGTEMTWTALLDKFAASGDERAKVNILGPHLFWSKNWPHDGDEMVRLLKVAEVPVGHTLFRHLTADDLREACRAKVFYIPSCEDFPQLEKKVRELGIEIWGQDLVLPIGMKNTEEWYLALARRYGNEEKAKEELKREFDLVSRQLKQNYNATHALTYMAGKRFGILGYGLWTASMTRFLYYDLNMRPRVVGLFAETVKGMERAKRLLEPLGEFIDFEVLENPSYFQYGQALKKAGVDFAVGHLQDKALVEGEEIPHLSLGGFYFINQFNFVPWPYFGVRGVLNLMGELWNVVDRVIYEKKAWPLTAYRPTEEDGNG